MPSRVKKRILQSTLQKYPKSKRLRELSSMIPEFSEALSISTKKANRSWDHGGLRLCEFPPDDSTYRSTERSRSRKMAPDLSSCS